MFKVLGGEHPMNLFSFFQFRNPITVDIHSHLLPGIDDGVKSIEESLSLIKKFKMLGYSKLITTPHIMSDNYPNTRTIINRQLSLVQEAIEEAKIDIAIEAGAEHYIDVGFLELLENREVVPFGYNYLLFETSYTTRPIILEQAIFEMLSQGYTPVLAHPERYLYLHDDIEHYKTLKALGVLFQVNIKSLHTKSSKVYKMAHLLIKSGLVDFVGSDVHRMRDLDNLEKIIKHNEYRNIFKKNTIINNK